MEAQNITALKSFDIWVEGYSAIGQSSRATHCGKFEATTFKEACQKFYETCTPSYQSYFSKERDAVWACRLFDNEADARKTFG